MDRTEKRFKLKLSIAALRETTETPPGYFEKHSQQKGIRANGFLNRTLEFEGSGPTIANGEIFPVMMPGCVSAAVIVGLRKNTPRSTPFRSSRIRPTEKVTKARRFGGTETSLLHRLGTTATSIVDGISALGSRPPSDELFDSKLLA